MSDEDGAAAPTCAGGPSIAVIGSGPSGCYVAQFLGKQWPNADITIFERLPTPYGLIRYGVAPDHQGSKAVTKQFDRLFTTGGVRFAGNVTVGRDVEFERITELFDIVVLATGLPADRELGVPRPADAPVIGAGGLLRALNGHPHAIALHGASARGGLGRRLVVVGMGNVAIDVVRLLSKEASGLVGSDIDDQVRQLLLPESPASIEVLSRSSAGQAKCDVSMLREVLSMPNIAATATGLTPHDDGPIAEMLRSASTESPETTDGAETRTRVAFHFRLSPERIEGTAGGGSRVHAVSEDGSRHVDLVADTIVTAIGFTHGCEADPCCPTTTWSGAHVYRVGWLSRGSVGTVADNRKQARAVADVIIDDVNAGRVSVGRPGFRALGPSMHARVVSFAQWRRIEEFELSSAPPDRCRRKITDVDHMLAVAGYP
ncbi:ferredoxin [Mycolicibacterium murale]|uniref:ferredoxin--NADP(+) reductase n=1 Tax=Mycolicibacterium murale TaxID=182220 RepID=A0A7I9WG79_9MYCO|nr:FAD-dependent oxidoreductase [Mycolicibacterium murale]MCV7182523.1 FAD-dependent oxidoreductase [Mycolicibacterium murale]GFG56745.1 ferredoxin [Mycolicibacterium murale]